MTRQIPSCRCRNLEMVMDFTHDRSTNVNREMDLVDFFSITSCQLPIHSAQSIIEHAADIICLLCLQTAIQYCSWK